MRKRAIRRLTASKKTLIRELVDVLYDFLPLSSRSNKATTFITIFAESNVESYLDKGDYKKANLTNGFENLIRYHRNLPYTVIRKVVPAAIDYRRYERKPLKQEELDSLIDILVKLDIDMRSELGSIVLDETVPEIKVPPEKLVERLKDHPLVEEISTEPLVQFEHGHFNESVRKATERFEVKVKELSGSDDIGKRLMSRVFSIPNPDIKLNPLTTDNEKNIQEGYQYITMGMMQAIRNIFSHGDEDQRPPEEAYEMLLFVNWLFRQLNQIE